MNKEELFLKYIDGQVTQEEKLQVNLLLSESEANKQLFEKVKSTREEILLNLGLLNTLDPIVVPPFENKRANSKKSKVIHFRLWHYAALAVILLGLYFGMKQLGKHDEDQVVEVIPEGVEESKTIYEELDCYISPNRCWNQKQLVWTFIEINQ